MEKQTGSVKQDALLAATILETSRRRNEFDIEDISHLLHALRISSIDIGQIDLRRVPGGFYSEDLEILMSHYLESGIVGQRNPLRLNPEGVKFLTEIVEEERNNNQEAIKVVEEVLKSAA